MYEKNHVTIVAQGSNCMLSRRYAAFYAKDSETHFKTQDLYQDRT